MREDFSPPFEWLHQGLSPEAEGFSSNLYAELNVREHTEAGS